MNYPNSPDKYYWKNNDGSPGLYPGTNTAAKSGYWQRYLTFEQKYQIQMQNDRSFEYAMVGVLAAPFAILGGLEGGAFVWGSLESSALNAAAQGVAQYYRYAPVAGALGRTAAGFFDESGGVGMQNAGLSKIESIIVHEAQGILNAKEFQLLEEGYKNGKEVSVTINDRIIHYAPDLKDQGLTLMGTEFILGKGAFDEGKVGVAKTLLHELFRVYKQTEEVIKEGLGAGGVGQYDRAARQWADDAVKQLKF